MDPVSPPSSASQRSRNWLKLLIPIFILVIAVIVFLIIGRSKANPSNISTGSPQTLTNYPFASSSPPAQATPTESPNPHAADLTLTPIIESTDSGKLKGVIRVTNKGSYVFSDLYPSISVLFMTQTPTQENGVTVNVQNKALVSAVPLPSTTIQANQTQDIPFEMPYPAHGQTGQYQIQAGLTDKLGTFYGLGYTYTALQGSNDLVQLTNCKVVAQGTDYGLEEGVPVDKGQSVEGKCTFTNSSSHPMVLTPHIDYASFHYFFYPQSDKMHADAPEKITLNPGETKTATFTLPSNLSPQVYEAFVNFNDQNKLSQSDIVTFRWTIKGASARIDSVSLDKDFYRSGDTSTISVVAYPSMDLYWRANPNYHRNDIGTVINGSKLAVTLSGANGVVCGQQEYLLPNLPLPTNDQKSPDPVWNVRAPLKINKDCINPKAEIKVINGSSVLAQTTTSTMTSSAHQLAAEQTNLPSFALPIVLGALLIVVIAVVFMLVKKKRVPVNPPTLLLLIFISSAVVFVHLIPQASANNSYAYPGIVGTGYGPSGSAPTEQAWYPWGVTGDLDIYEVADCCQNVGTSTRFAVTQPSWSGTTGTETVYGFYGWGGIIQAGCGNSYGNGGKSEIFIDNNGSYNGAISTGFTVNGEDSKNPSNNPPFYFPWSLRVTATAASPGSSVTKKIVLHYSDDGEYWSTDNFNLRHDYCIQWYCGWVGYTPANSGGANYGVISLTAPAACTDTANHCANAGSYTDANGYSCTGTEQPACINNTSVCGGTCDSTYPSISIVNPPSDTCYKNPTGTNGTPWSTTQPLKIRVDDTHNAQGASVISSGISNVSVKITYTNGTQTRQINTNTLYSGTATNGTYSLTIPSDTSSFPSNGVRYSITAYATDNTSHTSNSASYAFTFDGTGNSCIAPHVQTQNGDVHSQRNVGN